MTDIQAALGVSQLKRLDEFVKKRHEIAKIYNRLLENNPVVIPWQHPDSFSGMHLYIIRLKLDEIKLSHRQVFEQFRSAGILVNLHYIPVYRHPFYEKIGLNPTKSIDAVRVKPNDFTLAFIKDQNNTSEKSNSVIYIEIENVDHFCDFLKQKNNLCW
jgi:dTDP-4-amino-4,6-dideoxygalactose transaminase